MPLALVGWSLGPRRLLRVPYALQPPAGGYQKSAPAGRWFPGDTSPCPLVSFTTHWREGWTL